MTLDRYIKPLPQKSLLAVNRYYMGREVQCGRCRLDVVGIKHTQCMRPPNKIVHTLVFLVEVRNNSQIPSEVKHGLEKEVRTYFGLDTFVRLIKSTLSKEYDAVEEKQKTLIYSLWCGEEIARFCMEHNIEFDIFHVQHYRLKYREKVVDIHPHLKKWVDMKVPSEGKFEDISLFLQQFLSQ